MTHPTATEEQDHLWINEGGGQRNLTAEVGELICEADCGRVTPNELARCIDLAAAALSHPYIASALEMKSKLVVPSGEAGEMKK